jgi:hypothetical protein
LLTFKPVPRLAYVGNFALAYLVGVGAAVALGGALLGTLVPQIRATSQALSVDWQFLADGVLVVVGTVCTLMVFNFGVPEQRGLAGMWGQLTRLLASIGRMFLTVALGVAFAGALTASLSILIGRIQPIIDTIVDLYITLIGG